MKSGVPLFMPLFLSERPAGVSTFRPYWPAAISAYCPAVPVLAAASDARLTSLKSNLENKSVPQRAVARSRALPSLQVRLAINNN